MDRAPIDWRDFPLPLILPELVITPTHAQIFMFSAVTWNRHHIHYSRDAAVAEGLPDVVVHRALIGNFFMRVLTNWLGDMGDVKTLAWKVQSSAVPNRKLFCQGVVTEHEPGAKDDGLVCELTIANDTGETVATAKATICIRDIS